MQGWLLSVSLLLGGCVGTTGGDLFPFEATASGPAASDGQGYSFESGRGYAVSLTRARVHVGAVYLNRGRATSVASDTSCTLAGIYVAEVTSGLDVDALSPEPQAFPVLGQGTADLAHTGEVWLTSGDVNATSDSRVVLDVAGTATRGDRSYPFEARLTIGANRLETPPNPALPGAKPICKQRIVTPIPVNAVPARGGKLHLRIDPAGFFGNVDFSTLSASADGVFRFDDASATQASANLYAGLRASTGTYQIEFHP
jgi:hypothetical protein